MSLMHCQTMEGKASSWRVHTRERNRCSFYLDGFLLNATS